MLYEARGYFRLRTQIALNWSIPKLGISGDGMIFNVSFTGVQVQVDKPVKNEEELLVFGLECPQIPFLPKKAKMIWAKPAVEAGNKGSLCGLHFFNPDPAWSQWMEGAIQQLSETGGHSILVKYLGISDP